MPVFHIRHVTRYRYRSAVAFGEHRLMLRPREAPDQRTLGWDVRITPEPAQVAWAEDPSGNLYGIARFARRSRELVVEARLAVEQRTYAAETLSLAPSAASCPFTYGADEAPDLMRFVERQQVDPERAVDAWARDLLAADPARETLPFLLRLNAAIRRDFAYIRREEPGIQSAGQTLRTGRGSCRDFAVLFIEAARTQGLAARFVSGYLHTGDGDGRTLQAGGFTHAWAQVYLPGAGWIDFDPTSGTAGNANLVRVAVVRDPRAASPLSGTFVGFPSDFEGMSVDVTVADVTVPDALAASDPGESDPETSRSTGEHALDSAA